MTAATIRGLLFDKDGTLLDFDATWPPAYRAIAAALAEAAGEPALAERLLRLGGYDEGGVLDPESMLACGTTADIVAFWAAQPELANLAGIAERIDTMFLDYATRAPAVVADLGALFERLRGRGLRLGVATNDSAAAAHAWLAGAGVDHLLDFVSGADSGYGAKPDPAVMHGFCAATGLAPGEVAVVGDSMRDLDFAHAAGAGLAVAVLTGVTPRAQLDPHADRVLDSIAGLEAVLT